MSVVETFPGGGGHLFVAGGAGYFARPNLAALALTSGAANNYGVYGQLTATEAAAFFVVELAVLYTINTGVNNEAWSQFQLAIGAAGVEVVIHTLRGPGFQNGNLNPGTFGELGTVIALPFPVLIAAGTRLAIRVATPGAASTWQAGITAVAQADVA